LPHRSLRVRGFLTFYHQDIHAHTMFVRSFVPSGVTQAMHGRLNSSCCAQPLLLLVDFGRGVLVSLSLSMIWSKQGLCISTFIPKLNGSSYRKVATHLQ